MLSFLSIPPLLDHRHQDIQGQIPHVSQVRLQGIVGLGIRTLWITGSEARLPHLVKEILRSLMAEPEGLNGIQCRFVNRQRIRPG